MILLQGIAGFLLVLIVLWEAFESIVLPRRVVRRFRLTRLYYRSTWAPWKFVAKKIKGLRLRETYLSVYGPLSVLCLFVVWATLLVFGFAFLYGSIGRYAPHPNSYLTDLYFSGTTLFTLGLGDVIPHTSGERFLAVVESGLGLGFLALVLSYLPVLYQAFSRREVDIVLLDARAGSPPTAAELLRRHTGETGHAALRVLLRDWEHWSAEILESHVSYPSLCYFRSQHNNESWLASITAILDSTTLLILSSADDNCTRQARLTFAICRHTVADLAQVFSLVPRTAADRLPEADLQRILAAMGENGFEITETPEMRAKMAKLREMYEPYVTALAELLYLDLPPWTLSQAAVDNWKTTAWGRISGYTPRFHHKTTEAVTVDDHD
jgi:hypothetical protein